MNNTLVIKNADFSAAKIDSLNLVKLNITNDGAGYAKVSGGTYSINTTPSGTFKPAEECAHSAEITLPANTIALFGTTNALSAKASFNAWILSPDDTEFPISTVTPWIYYDANTSEWKSLNKLVYENVACRPEIMAYKEPVYTSDLFAVSRISGPIYGSKFASNLDITKVIFNWFTNTSKQATEIGIILPEIYALVK